MTMTARRITFDEKIKLAREFIKTMYERNDNILYSYYLNVIQVAQFWYNSPDDGCKRSGKKRAHKLMDRTFRMLM